MTSSPTIALHEFVHLVTLHVNPKFTNNPRWLWEAIAIYKSENQWKYANKPQDISPYFKSISENLNADFNDNTDIYEVGYTVAEYIDKRWGNDALVELVKTNGDLNVVLNISMGEFIAGWSSFVENTYFNPAKTQ